jgi:hypothetical protein
MVPIATSDVDSQPWPIDPGGVLGLVPDVGAELPSCGQVSDVGAGPSLSSQMDNLMRSCMNTPGGGYS